MGHLNTAGETKAEIQQMSTENTPLKINTKKSNIKDDDNDDTTSSISLTMSTEIYSNLKECFNALVLSNDKRCTFILQATLKFIHDSSVCFSPFLGIK